MFFIVLVPAALLSAAGVPASAADERPENPESAGTAPLHFFLDLSERYESNIYLVPSGGASSLVTALRPGFRLRQPVRQHLFRLDYWSELLGYSENPSINNTINNYAEFSAQLAFPSGLGFALEDNYAGTTDPATSELTERVHRNQNDLSLRVSYTFSRLLTGSLKYSQLLYDYIPEGYKSLLNRRESEGNAELAITLTPRTSALVEYGAGEVRYAYATNPNSSRNQAARVGLRGRLTPRMNGELKAGVKYRNYTQVQGMDTTLPVFSLTAVNRFTERTALRLSAFRNFVESANLDERYYVSSGLTFQLEQGLLDSWKLALDGDLENNEYPNEQTTGSRTQKRRDVRFFAGLGITYLSVLPWLRLGAGYHFIQRNSNFGPFSYTDNVTDVKIRMVF
ncbi:MAG: outer membrane beta-barrel protein [Endomicrobiales bacterium]